MNARLRLALRAEKAFGLSSLPIVRAKSVSLGSRQNPAVQGVVASDVSSGPERRLPAARKPASASQPVAAVPLPIQPPSPPVLFEMPTEPFTAPVLAREEKLAALRELDTQQVMGCQKCRLSQTRTQTVFGEGDPDSPIMFIGEGPGENEDLQGRPFVGKAGQLLDKMIGAMGFARENVFICNIVKCRPPNNRQPLSDETAACTPYLLRQVEIVRPRVIVTLGLPSTQFLLSTKNSMSKMRGRWHTWRGIRVMPTYHPAYVLRAYTRDTREAVWSDLQQVLSELGMPLPSRKSD